MKRITLVLAVALGLALATFAGLWSSNSASAGRFEDGLKCYKAQRVQILDQNPATSLLYISDQFEEKNLIIKKPINYCTRAEKSEQLGGTGAGFADFDELVCYAFKDAPRQPRFQPQEIFTGDQFDFNFYVVTKPYSLCEPADKEFASSTAAGGGPFEDFAFKCYRVRRVENGDRFEKISLRLFDQFEQGGKDVRLGRPTVFCTQVEEKKNKAKNDHIDHAITLEPEDEDHSSTISAGSDRSDPQMDCPDIVESYGHSVWYTFIPPNDVKHITLDTNGSTYDTVLGIYTGSPGNLEQVDCDDDSGIDLASFLSVKVTPYTKYYIVVGAFAGTPGGKLKLQIDVTGVCASCTGGFTAAAAAENAQGDASGHGPDWNLMCYSISQRAPDGIRLRTTDQFTLSEFDLGRGDMYCTPAAKCKFIFPKGAGDAALAGARPFSCNQ